MSGFGVVCGKCGGHVYMETCRMSNPTDHDWVTASECQDCGERYLVVCPDCGGDTPMSTERAHDARERARRNMQRLNIPQGTDNPDLIALGAKPVPCTVCGGRGWHTAGGNDPMTCSCPAGEAFEGRGDTP